MPSGNSDLGPPYDKYTIVILCNVTESVTQLLSFGNDPISLMMEVACFPETLLMFYQTARYHIPKHNNHCIITSFTYSPR
jgi:hypothetical protein